MKHVDLHTLFYGLGGFWRRHPALWVGIVALLSTAFYQSQNPIYLVPFSLVVVPFWGWLRGLVLSAATIAALFFIPKPPVPDQNIVVEGTFYPHSVKEKRTSFGPKWEYQGMLSLRDHTQFAIKISLPSKPFIPRPDSDYKYHLRGIIKEGYRGPIFLPQKNSRWIPIEPLTYGFSEWRYHAKTKLKKEIQKRFSSEKAARFLEGISTGDFQDRVMSLEFSRFGLQHIMAVSGFHFAVITGILCWIFFGVLGKRWGAALLLAALVGYFIFLGGTPSITRAWVSASLLMIGAILGMPVKSLNSLGLGLLAVVAFEPAAIHQIGFQFSFAITAAILLLTSPFETILEQFYPTRRLHHAVHFPWYEKIGYVLLQWIRKGTALSLAVNVCALPMTLYIFGKFPLWSLFFNLFFPVMVALAIFFLILGLTVGIVIEYCGYCPNVLNNWYTDFMLNLAYNFPQKWDSHVEVYTISAEMILLYLTALFTLGILLEARSQDHVTD